MTAEAESVLREALALSAADRADLAAELLASLEPEDDLEEVERTWAVEIDRRLERAESEGFPGEDWTVLRQRLTDELTE